MTIARRVPDVKDYSPDWKGSGSEEIAKEKEPAPRETGIPTAFSLADEFLRKKEVPPIRESLPLNYGEKLRPLLREAGRIRDRITILEDYSQREKHHEAAHDVVDALQKAARIGLDVFPAQPSPKRSSLHEIADIEEWLHSAGYTLDTTLRQYDLDWGPRGLEPPSAVRDLRELCHQAAWPNFDVSAPAEPLDRILRRIESIAAGLLAGWSPDLAEAMAAEAVAPTTLGQRRNRIFTFVAAITMAGALLDLPGIVNDFPQEAEKLGGNISRLIEIVRTAATDSAGEVLERLENAARQRQR